MRKLIISILLAGAAASPALAQDQGRWHHDGAQSDNEQSRDDRSQAREQRQEARDQARSERSNDNANVERMQQAQQAQQAQQQAARQYEGRQQWQGQGQGGRWDRSRFEGQRDAARQQALIQQQQQQQQAMMQQQQRQAERSYNGYRGYRGGFSGQAVQADRAQRDGAWARNRQGWSEDRGRDYRERGAQPQGVQGNRWANGGWNRDWRNDRRYDWRDYRDRHRSVFHLGLYFDPFGYGYRQFDVGYSLAPLYFGQQYWIDPSMYELPYPPPGTVWVRYWNDAVLVDTYSGQVVDVIHNFFW